MDSPALPSAAEEPSPRRQDGPPRPRGGQLHAVFLGMVLLLESGCSFYTFDSSRPFVREWLPDRQERAMLAEHMASTEAQRQAIQKSLRRTQQPLRIFSIRKYGEPFSYHYISGLVNALELFPDNPYAWIGLGAYLGINFQPEQAATATRVGVELILRQSAAEPKLAPLMTPALRDGLLNLVNFSLQAEELGQARWALDQLDEIPSLDPLHKLASTRLKALTLLRLGDLQDARDTLTELEAAEQALAESELDFSLWYDYPRFRTAEERRATNDWLHAQILMAGGEYSEAIAILEASIRREDTTESGKPVRDNLDDDELWEAHLALANAYFSRAGESGDEERLADLAAARAVLEDVLDDIPSREFIPEEYVAFNLGNVLFAQDEYEEAIKSYKKATREFSRTFAELRKAWIKHLGEKRKPNLGRNVDAQASTKDPPTIVLTPETARQAAERFGKDTVILEILLSENAALSMETEREDAGLADLAPLFIRLLRAGLERSYASIREDSPHYRYIRYLGIVPEEAGRYIYGEAYNNLGNSYLELGKESTGDLRRDTWGKARRSYRTALLDNHYPTPEIPHVSLARIALKEERVTEAYLELVKALNINPLLRVAMDLLLEAARSAQDPGEAAGGLYLLADHLEQIAGPGGPSRGWVSALLAEVEEQLDSLAESEEKQALEARLRYLRGDDSSALAAYQAMTRGEASSIWPWAGLTRIAAQASEPRWLDQGIALAQNQQALSPWASADYRYLLLQRGERRLQEGEVCGALEDFGDALEASPGWSLAEQSRAFTREKLRQEGRVCP